MNAVQVPSLEMWEEQCARNSLMEFIPWVNKRYRQPTHLIELVLAFMAAVRGEQQRIVCDAPPRHAKSETMIQGIVWALWINPRLRFSYSTYGASLSRKMSRRGRNLATKLGIKFASSKLDEWVTEEGGGCIFSSVSGALTGSGVDIAIVDDSVKDRIAAESALKRERVWDWFNDVLSTRIEGYDPEGGTTGNGSIFVFQTRWHPDDLIGRLLKEGGWRHLHYPAVNDNEEQSLWPERWPLATMLERKARVGPYTWASLYQGEPRPRGESVFEGLSNFTVIPTVHRRAFGLDLAYASKSSRDWSVAVEMRCAIMGTVRVTDEHGREREVPDVHYFVTNVARKQVKPEAFRELLAPWARMAPGVRWRWYTSTTEAGSADLMKPSIQVTPVLATGDKLIRGQAYALAWRNGRVHLPEKAPWLDDFVKEHMNFTGVNDTNDDQVDAATAAFDELRAGAVQMTTFAQSGVKTGLAAASM